MPKSISNESQVGIGNRTNDAELQLVAHTPEMDSPLSPSTEDDGLESSDDEGHEAIYDVDLLSHDPKKRILIADYNVNEQDTVRKGYIALGPCQPRAHDFPKKLIIDESPAYYADCFTHQLQLTLVTVAKENGDCVWFFQQLAYLLNVLGMSCEKIQILRVAQAQQIVEALELGDIKTGQGLNQEMGLGRLGDTRFGSHYKPIIHVISLYPSIRRVFIKIGEDHSSSTKVIHAQTMLTSFEFVFMAHLLLTIFGYTDDLSNTLQKRAQAIVNDIDLIYLTKTQLQLLREDDGCDSFFKDVTSFCMRHGIKVPQMDDFYKPVARSKMFFKKSRIFVASMSKCS